MNEEGFVIDSDMKAEWALRKIREAQDERDRLLSLADLERARIDAEVKSINDRFDRDTGWLKSQLEQYFDSVVHKVTKTQERYQLLSGCLVRKKATVKYVRDNDAMIQWLKDNQMNEFIKTTYSPDWENLKKHTSLSEGQVVLDSGEIVEGVTAEIVPDEFTVSF